MKEAGLGSPNRRASLQGGSFQAANMREGAESHGDSTTLSMLVNGPQEDFAIPLCLTWARFCHLQRAETLGSLTWPTSVKKIHIHSGLC